MDKGAIIAIVIVLVLLLAVGGYFMMSSSSAAPAPAPVVAGTPAAAAVAAGAQAMSASGVDFGTANVSCPSGKITVSKAMYAGGSCAGADDTSVVAGLCNGQPSCAVNVIPSTYKMPNGQPGSLPPTDPCPNIQKTLSVAYTCQ
jgi:hypothetical protein